MSMSILTLWFRSKVHAQNFNSKSKSFVNYKIKLKSLLLSNFPICHREFVSLSISNTAPVDHGRGGPSSIIIILICMMILQIVIMDSITSYIIPLSTGPSGWLIFLIWSWLPWALIPYLQDNSYYWLHSIKHPQCFTNINSQHSTLIQHLGS